MRGKIHDNDSFTAVLERVKQTTIEAYDHQRYPFDRLVDELNLDRNVSHAPLFDVMVVLQNDVFSERSTKTFTITELDIELETSRFDLTFIFRETEKHIRVSINYNSDLFTLETIKRIGNHFENLLKSVLADKNRPISDLEMLGEEEKKKLLFAASEGNQGRGRRGHTLISDYILALTLYMLNKHINWDFKENILLLYPNQIPLKSPHRIPNDGFSLS